MTSRVGVTIITGGGTGIGAALARRLSSQNVPVVIVGRRIEKLLETKSLCDNPSNVRTVVADVSKPEGRDAILKSLGSNEAVDALVHNAAVLEPIGRLIDVNPDQFREHLSINLESPLFLTKALLPHLTRSFAVDDSVSSVRGTCDNEEVGKYATGRVLHISSGAAHKPYKGWGPYCTSKAAFHMMYQVLSAELGPVGVAVGSARPGVVDTPMQSLIREQTESDLPDVSKFRSLKEQGSLIDPVEVAAFLDWLLSKTSDKEFSEKEWDVRDKEHRHRWST
eukprot:CAMPEP_0194418810 /NCGR_PEP_ID=MMETSP0176-20130528/17981_1 /TAXON_ID=216777 /ORGANISM="Proboscia alata, Strain PI-D3" /LENGTH=279 /DNA_ID=CAMNT_0039225489 /DNA_START=18 /DNA_END=857 /DNA_ORIENTATION=-